MQNRSLLPSLTLILILLFPSGCTYIGPHAVTYTNQYGNLEGAVVKGGACSKRLFGIFTWGDSSEEAALENARLSNAENISHLTFSREISEYLIYSKTCTIVKAHMSTGLLSAARLHDDPVQVRNNNVAERTDKSEVEGKTFKTEVRNNNVGERTDKSLTKLCSNMLTSVEFPEGWSAQQVYEVLSCWDGKTVKAFCRDGLIVQGTLISVVLGNNPSLDIWTAGGKRMILMLDLLRIIRP